MKEKLPTSGPSRDEYNGFVEQVTNVTTGTISKASGITGGTLDNTTLYKVGNTVFASGRIHSLGEVATNQSFFTIPSGFRPKRTTTVMGYMFIKMNNVDMGARPLPATVNTSGAVSYAYSSQAVTDQVFFSGSWSVL